MSTERIQITPSVLTWARERAGLSVEDACQTFKKIEAWEAGASFPTYPQLEKLAEEFKLPVAVFFFPAPPDIPPISESFRTLPDQQFSEIPRRVRFLLRKAKALQINLAELTGEKNPAPRLITHDLTFPVNVEIGKMAGVVREYLGVSLEEQVRWASVEDALEGWRKSLNNSGIFVFKDAFKSDNYSGFCIYEEMFPIIYVNNSAAKTRQIFTLFHELAHLLFHTSGIDAENDEFIETLHGDARRIEIICNRFAAEFLAPEDAFEAAFAGQPPTEATAEVLASRFHVSRESIFRKFLNRGLIDEDTYRRAAARWKRQRNGGTGGNYYWTKIAYLGPEYITLALSQYYKNKIDDIQLAEYLDTKQKNISKLEDYFARRGV